MRATAEIGPPRSIDAERSVLGAILVDPLAFDVLPPGFAAEWFFRDSHQIIFRAMLSLKARGKEIDIITVDEELRRSDEHGRVYTIDRGAMDSLLDMANSVPHSAHTAYYADIVKDHAIRREAIRIGTELIAAQYRSDEDASEPVEHAMGELLNLAGKGSSESVLTMPEVMASTMAAMERRRGGELEGLPTGFGELDRISGGFVAGRMYILAARPAMGKTACALQMAVAIATNGARGLFVSQEMGHVELGERMVSGSAGIDSYRLRDAQEMTAYQWEAVTRATQSLSRLNLTIDDTPGRTAGQIAATARRLKAKGGLHFVAVDYAQLLEAEPGSKANRQEQVAKISRILKQVVARGLGVPLLVLSQLNRGLENREDKTPRMADLRESGALEQDADQVWLLHRPEYYDPGDQPGIVKFIIAKNRQGRTATIDLNFHGATTSFSEIDRNGTDF
jgi:replicative DNA helicase